MGNSCHDRPGVAVPDQHRLLEILAKKGPDDVLDMGLDINPAAGGASALALAGERPTWIDLMPGGAKTSRDVVPGPSAEARSRQKHHRSVHGEVPAPQPVSLAAMSPRARQPILEWPT